MKIIIENLLALQKLLLPSTPATPEKEAKITELRKLVPLPVLTHFDRMVVRGKKGVALVRHGVCSECHIRVPVGVLDSLVAPDDVYLCGICSCYLLLPAEEIAVMSQPAKGKPVARRTKKPQPAAAPVAPLTPANGS